MALHLRVRAGRLQAPARTWVHPSGRNVTVVAMVHTGEPAYYQQIRTLIDGLETAGAVVFCEDYTAPVAPADANPAEAAVFGDLRRSLHLTAIRMAELGWTMQAEALAPGHTWRQVDLDPLIVLRLAGLEPMRRRVRHAIAILDWDDQHTTAANVYRARMALWWRLSASRAGQRLLTRSTDPVLLDRRNRVALGAVYAISEDAVLVWGARHLPGLERGLRDRSYLPQVETWYTVCRLPSVRRAIADIALRRAPTGTTLWRTTT